LQDSLGGNAKTSLIVNISPSTYNTEETISSLNFGLRAMSVQNKPIINEAEDFQAQCQQLQEDYDKLAEEYNKLKSVYEEVVEENEKFKNGETYLELQRKSIQSHMRESSSKIITKSREELNAELEQKEEEISNLKHKYESMKNTNTNRTTEVNSNIVHNKLMDLNLTTKDNDNNNNAIPLHKYQDVINELNKTYKKYNETLHVIGKMQNDNKVIPKPKEDESAFMDKDELLDIPDCSTVQLLQIKSLLQLLVMEFTLNIKSKKILTDLLMIVGYSQKEIEKLMEGNKKIKRK
jgi:chromosome segregation ATPase